MVLQSDPVSSCICQPSTSVAVSVSLCLLAWLPLVVLSRCSLTCGSASPEILLEAKKLKKTVLFCLRAGTTSWRRAGSSWEEMCGRLQRALAYLGQDAGRQGLRPCSLRSKLETRESKKGGHSVHLLDI